MVLEIVDDVADRRVRAVLEQTHLRSVSSAGEIPLEGWGASVEHAVASRKYGRANKAKTPARGVINQKIRTSGSRPQQEKNARHIPAYRQFRPTHCGRDKSRHQQISAVTLAYFRDTEYNTRAQGRTSASTPSTSLRSVHVSSTRRKKTRTYRQPPRPTQWNACSA